MTVVPPPPVFEILSGEDGKASLPYIEFFDRIYRGDTGTDWTPEFTSLAVTGTPTITGKLYRIGRQLAYFSVRVVPATNTTSTGGTTYINNFPLVLTADGACLAVSGLLGSSAGMCDSATNRIYVPAWTSVTVPLTIVGFVEAR